MHDESPPRPGPQPELSAALDAAAATAGLVVSWAADLDLADVLAAMRLRERRRAGLDIPGWDEPDWSDPAAPAGGDPSGQAPVAGDPVAGDGRAGDPPGGDVLADGFLDDGFLADDPLGEEAAEAALAGAGQVAGLADLAGYARLSPGPALAGWLGSAPMGGLDDAGLVGSIGGWRKITSWAQAQELAAVAELACRRGAAGSQDDSSGDGPDGAGPGDMPRLDGGVFDPREAEFVPNEIALALTLTQSAAQDWMSLAVSLTRRLTGTMAALRAGTIDLARAKLVDQYTAVLDDDLARKVEDRILAKAGKRTTGQLRADLQRAVIAVDPAAAERRRREAEKCARVELSGEETGTASLGGRFLPVAHAAAAWARISAMAKAMQSSGAGGGMDLLRAQVFIGLLLGTLPLIPPPEDSPGDPRPTDGPAGPGDDPGSGDGPGPGDGCGGAGPDEEPGTGPGPGSSEPAGRPGDDRGAGGGVRRGGPGGGRRVHRGGDRGEPRPDRGTSTGQGSHGAPDGCDGGGGERGSPWERQPAPRDEDAPQAHDNHDQSHPPDLGTPDDQPPDRHFGRPPRGWPHIPGPGEPAAPGCAPGWAGGSPPGSGGTTGGGTAGGGTAGGGTAGGGTAGGGTAGGQAAGAAVLTIPWRTLAGMCEEPGLLSRIGPVTAHAARDLAAAALADPACVWKFIIASPSGQAMAVTRIRRPRTGTQAGNGPPGGAGTAGGPGLISQVTLTIPLAFALAGSAARPPATTPGTAGRDAAGPGATAPGGRLRGMLAAALRAARHAAERAAGTPADGSGPCTHQDSVPGYRVPGRLRDLIEARDQKCGNPICRQPASRCDIDHSIPYDQGGLTCSCDLSPECRRHHRLKQLRRWQLRQPRPGHLLWITPAGLTYTTTPPPHPA